MEVIDSLSHLIVRSCLLNTRFWHSFARHFIMSSKTLDFLNLTLALSEMDLLVKVEDQEEFDVIFSEPDFAYQLSKKTNVSHLETDAGLVYQT